MNFSSAIQYTIQACKNLSIPYTLPDNSGQFLCITKNNKPYFYIHQTVPLNSQSHSKLATDKLFTYQMLSQSSLHIPKTMGFIDPHVESQYAHFRQQQDISEIVDGIVSHFSFPVILKPNSKSQGIHVFLCHNQEEIYTALSTIFDQTRKDYDYLALAQQYIEPQAEFRLISIDGKLQFAYQKDISNATFTGNLSPLHWQNSQAIIVTDPHLIEQFQGITRTMFETTGIRFCGVDVIQREDGDMFVIELNCQPSFDHFLKHNSNDLVKKLYSHILLQLE